MASISHTYERRILLAGASNFRDLGGYATEDGRWVRWRRVFRSDALHELTPDDVEQLIGCGVQRVIDLRSAREIEAFAASPLEARGVQHHHMPLVGNMTDRAGTAARLIGMADHEAHADAYLDLLEEAKPAVGTIFEALAESEAGGTVFHCTGGRDRTGLIAGVLLRALGVPPAVIAEDYALTTQFLAFPEHRIARLRELFGQRIELKEIPPTHSEVMLLMLAGLDARYGSAAGFLREAGVSSDQLDALRHALLEAA